MDLIPAATNALLGSEPWRAQQFEATLAVLIELGLEVEHEAEVGESWATLMRAESAVGFLWADAPLALACRSTLALWQSLPHVELVLVDSLSSTLVPPTEELVAIFPAFRRDLEEFDDSQPWLTAMDIAIGTM